MIGRSVVKKRASNSASGIPWWCSLSGWRRIRSMTLITRTLSLGEMLAYEVDRGQGFEGGDIPTAAHDDVRLAVFLVAGPLPDPGAAGAVQDRLFHRQVLQGWLFPGHDHIDVVPAAQAVVGHREEGVGVGRRQGIVPGGFEPFWRAG